MLLIDIEFTFVYTTVTTNFSIVSPCYDA